MARYSLILKDQTYMSLMQKAAAQNQTFGKFVNILLNKYSEGQVETPKPYCFYCGSEEVKAVCYDKKQKVCYVCASHYVKRKVFPSWKDSL